jgi:pilus assembly protein CpaE
MAELTRIVVVLDDGIAEEEVAPSLPRGDGMQVVAVVDGVDRAAAILADAGCDVVLVACAGYSERVLLFTESAVRVDPERALIVLSSGAPNGFVRRVFEVGADDIVSIPQPPDTIRFAIQKAIARKQSAAHRDGASGPGVGRLIVVLGPKGGTGKTLTAMNLAVAMQERGQRVALVDLDLQFGDVALGLGLKPDRTMYDLVLDNHPIEAEMVERFMVDHESGVRVLIAPKRPDQASAVTVEALRDIYAALRSTYDAVIADTPPGFTAEVIASIDLSTDLVMVGTLDSLSLKNTRLGLETLELMRYDPGDVKIVLNRANSVVGISSAIVLRVLGRAPDVSVPSDREVARTVNEGLPIVSALPRSECAKAFRELASLYSTERPLEDAEPADVDHAKTSSRRRRIGRRS